jgi:hypothetical protein
VIIALELSKHVKLDGEKKKLEDDMSKLKADLRRATTLLPQRLSSKQKQWKKVQEDNDNYRKPCKCSSKMSLARPSPSRSSPPSPSTPSVVVKEKIQDKEGIHGHPWMPCTSCVSTWVTVSSTSDASTSDSDMNDVSMYYSCFLDYCAKSVSSDPMQGGALIFPEARLLLSEGSF